LETEKDYPASARPSSCHFDAEKVKAKVKDIVKVDGNPEAIMTALLK